MIKIDKDFSDIPASLDSDLTKKRRDEVIVAGSYPKSKNIGLSVFTAKAVETYDSRYKCEDVKTALKNLYKRKCAYCDQKAPSYHVEHYRPKDIYYWLVYSWDNLLLSCRDCNSHKLNKFEIEAKKRISIDYPRDDIHNLGDVYDELEQPKLVNPEKEDVHKDLVYTKLGGISSKNTRVQHTIKTCRIDRDDLNADRKTILDELRQKIESRITESRFGDKEALIKLKGFLEDFRTDSENPVKNFISFRRYIIENWLEELLKEYNIS